MNPGDRFLDYRIVKQLGWGQFGEVYLADNTQKHGDPVALKVVRKVFNEDDRLAQQAERNGADLQKQLCAQDRRVTAVNAYGFSPTGEFFIEMEYVDGEDLSEPIIRREFTPQRAAEIAFELCEMLDNLGRVVHGDLKPRNIRLNRNGEVRVLDFGIAKAISESRTHTHSHWASKPYASPERLETGTVDMRSDLWSVGVMLYQMISGELPFNAPPEQLEARIRSAEPPPPLPEACPEPLRQIVFKMLARDPEARYATAATAAADLKSFLEGRPVAADADETVRVTPPRPEPPPPPEPAWTPARAQALDRRRGAGSAGAPGALAVRRMARRAAASRRPRTGPHRKSGRRLQPLHDHRETLASFPALFDSRGAEGQAGGRRQRADPRLPQ